MNEVKKYWFDSLQKIVSPVFLNLSVGKLGDTLHFQGDESRRYCCMLEALGRSFCGFAPFLDDREMDAEEEGFVTFYRDLLTRCLDHATNPASPDYMRFDGAQGAQPLVDAAFLAHGLVRSGAFAQNLSPALRAQIVRALTLSREIVPHDCNWVLFSAMVEAGIFVLGGDYDPARVVYAVRSFERWYVGDGMYGDGDVFHMNYYNSFVIHPMLVDLTRVFGDRIPEVGRLAPGILSRAARYAAILERFINRDGTYPVVGRSVTYRFGAFQLLSQAAAQHFLPAGLSPASVRCALTAVIRRGLEGRIFDEDGWLLIGVWGDQSSLGESYICTGSLYLCSAVFLPLGLPDTDPFWSSPDEKWTSLRLTDGEDSPRDVNVR